MKILDDMPEFTKAMVKMTILMGNMRI